MVTTKKPKKAAVKKPKKAVKTKKVTAKKTIEKANVDKVPEVKLKKDYIYSTGRRKSSVARVRFYKKGNNEIIVNGKDYKKYFAYFEFQKIIEEPMSLTDKLKNGKISIKVTGGGARGQAESIRLGISRILLLIDEKLRPTLRSNKLLTRDPRVKERKKYGLKKARRAPQWQKR